MKNRRWLCRPGAFSANRNAHQLNAAKEGAPMLKARMLVSSLLIAFSFSTSTSAATPPTCKGVNVLEELKIKKPGLHKEIIEEGAKFKNGRALFWRIEKDGVADSYLFGTVHVTDPRVHDLPTPVKSAFDASRILILEAVNLNDAAVGKAMISVMAQSMFNPVADKNLSDYLTADEMAKAVKISAGMGFPAEIMKLLKPWLIAISLALPPCEANRAKAGLLSLDAVLEERAKKTGKPAIGLETPEEQLRAMASIPLEAQIAWLKSSIELYDRSEDFLETMIQLYLNRNLAAMLPLSIKISKDPETAKLAMDSFQKTLIVKRNLGMAEGAKPELDKGGVFIGVGALHLGGDQGLVELFRKAGYKVTAME